MGPDLLGASGAKKHHFWPILPGPFSGRPRAKKLFFYMTKLDFLVSDAPKMAQAPRKFNLEPTL